MSDLELQAEAEMIWTMVFARDEEGRKLLHEGADAMTRNLMAACFVNGYVAGVRRNERKATAK